MARGLLQRRATALLRTACYAPPCAARAWRRRRQRCDAGNLCTALPDQQSSTRPHGRSHRDPRALGRSAVGSQERRVSRADALDGSEVASSPTARIAPVCFYLRGLLNSGARSSHRGGKQGTDAAGHVGRRHDAVGLRRGLAGRAARSRGVRARGRGRRAPPHPEVRDPDGWGRGAASRTPCAALPRGRRVRVHHDANEATPRTLASCCT